MPGHKVMNTRNVQYISGNSVRDTVVVATLHILRRLPARKVRLLIPGGTSTNDLLSNAWERYLNVPSLFCVFLQLLYQPIIGIFLS